MNAIAIVTSNPAAVRDVAILDRLGEYATDARGAYASNTERAFRSDIRTFVEWASSAGRISMPSSPETVVAFIEAMTETKAPATVRRYVSSIATYHRAAGVANPAETAKVKLAMKRLHRAKGRAQAQAAPLTRQLVERMLAASGNTLRDLRNKALLAVAYDTLCRRSELVALKTEDLAVAADGAGTVVIRRSKTDQEGVGMVRYLASDTVRHVTAWRKAAGIETGVLFRAVLKGSRLGDELTGGEVSRLYKGMAEAAGMTADEVRKVSGHSSRVGAACDMVGFGVDLPSVMKAGGWKSAEMVGRYTAQLDARRSGSAKLAVLQNRE